MPYKSEKIKIENTKYDRRIKLTEEQKKDIKYLYESGQSQRALARTFNVSRTTIRTLVNVDYAKKRKAYTSQYLKKYEKNMDKDTRNQYMRNHRHYKNDLYLNGKIK